MNRCLFNVAGVVLAIVLNACRSSGDSAGTASGTNSAGSSLPVVSRPTSLASESREERLFAYGEWTGFSRNSRGLIVRTETRTCPGKLPRVARKCTPKYRQAGACSEDAQCDDKPNGYCEHMANTPTCACHYGCMSDSDCGKGQVCFCGEPAGVCLDNNCKADGCAEPLRCASYFDGCTYKAFYCLSEAPAPSCVP